MSGLCIIYSAYTLEESLIVCETLRKQNNIAESEVNKAMKNALRVIQATGKISSVKQVDSVFRDSLANTAKSMVEVLVNDKDWSYKSNSHITKISKRD